MTTTSTTPTQSSNPAAATPKANEREVAFEHLVSGRLALQVLRNQLDTQIAGLRAQLAVAESQKRQAEEMLVRAEAKLERQHPHEWAYLMEEAPPESKRSRR